VLCLDLAKGISGGTHQSLWGAARRAWQMRIDLSESWFDGIEIGRVFGEEFKARVTIGDRLGDGCTSMTAEIVHHRGIAWSEGGTEALFGIGRENLGIDGPLDHQGGERRHCGA